MSKYASKKFQCPFCPVEVKDQFSHENKFVAHLNTVHSANIATSEDLEQYYIDHVLSGVRPTCKCGCGTPTKFYGWKNGFPTPFLRGHNALEQGNFTNPDKIKELVKKRAEGYTSGRLTIWNKNKKMSPIDSSVQEHLSPIIDIDIVNPDPTRIYFPETDSVDKRAYKKQKTTIARIMRDDIDPEAYLKQDNIARAEIVDYVQLLGFEVHTNIIDIIPDVNLEIWIPSKNLAIDYVGFYWKSDPKLNNKTYHQDKFEACSKENVSLYMIYEDEWRDKKELVKTMIRHRLGLSKEVYHARSLTVKQLSVQERSRFFDKSHLEGDVNSHIAFGLVTADNEVVAAMSLRRAFHRQYQEYYEVGRSACKQDAVVHGWIGKLTKRCFEYAKSAGKKGLVTYVDSRVGIGKAYELAGFVVAKESTGPRLWWTDFTNKFNRFQFKADLPNGKNQAQVCEEAGVVALFGMGNKLLKME
jgi:hypothetical protein